MVVVRCPEADWRPQQRITNAVVSAASRHPAGITVVDVLANVAFNHVEDQINFYAPSSLVANMQSTLSLAQLLQPSDLVFFADAWNPAIPTLRYLLACDGGRRLQDNPATEPKFFGIMHSSVDVPSDILQPHKYSFAGTLESAIMNAVDGVFVATEAGRDYLLASHASHARGIHVTGLPFLVSKLTPSTSPARDSRTVVWSHRWTFAKGVDTLVDLARDIKAYAAGDNHPDASDDERSLCGSIVIKVLHPVPISEDAYMYREAREAGIEFVLCPTRREYFDQLARAAVVLSTARLETLGYSILEGWERGCYPLVPILPAYAKIWRGSYAYSHWDLRASLCRVLSDPPTRRADGRYPALLEGARKSLEEAAGNMVSIMVNAYEGSAS